MTDKCTNPEGHTKTPWKLFGQHLVEIQDAHGNPIVGWMGFDDSRRSFEEHQANGRLIVEAVNAHTSLTERVRGFEQTMDALVERAERVQEGEDWDMAEFILRKRDAFLENEKDDPTATDPAD